MAGSEELAALSARVARIEAALQGDEAHGARDAGTWWLLEGLRSRPQPTVAYGGLVGETDPVEWQIERPAQTLLDQEWGPNAPTLAALGHPVRLRLLQLVARGEASTAAELTDLVGEGSSGQIYHHLRTLTGAGWLRTTTRGRHVVPPERLVPLLTILSAAE